MNGLGISIKYESKRTKRILSFTGFGFASGLPYVLVFITLTAWLRSEGLDLSVIGFLDG